MSRSEVVSALLAPLLGSPLSEIAAPRDRNGSFEPKIVRKRQRRSSGVDTAKWVKDTRETVAVLGGKLDAQGVAIRELAAALAQRDEAVDVEALVARIEAAIERVTVRLDVSASP